MKIAGNPANLPLFLHVQMLMNAQLKCAHLKSLRNRDYFIISEQIFQNSSQVF